jgi:hypothetical protein
VDLWKSYISPKELSELRFHKALRELFRHYLEKGEVNTLLLSKGNGFPTPLFWQHPTRTNNFYSWSTDFVKVFSRSDAGVAEEEQRLNKQISDWGILINHGYFVRNIYEDGVLSEQNGKIVIDPYFDKTLGLMARMREERNLYTTTVRKLLEYWILCEKISFYYAPDGSVFLSNNNDKAIKGLSLAVHADSVKINGNIPESRRVGENTVFWFDIPAGNCVKITVVP